MTGQPLPQRFGGGRYDQRPPVTRLSFDPASLARPLADLEHVTTRRRPPPGRLRPRDRRRPHRALPAPLRGLPRPQAHPRPQGGRGGHHPRRGRARARRAHRPPARSTSSSVLGARRHRRGRGRVVQPALPRQGARSEGMRLSLRGTFRPQGGRQSFVGQGPRDPRRGGRGGRAHRGRRARVPGQRAGLGQAPARPGARGRAGDAPAAGPAAARSCSCARACPAAPTRSRPCTCRARWRRRARPASAWCSRSCCSCRPGCCCTSRSSSGACRRRRCPRRATLSRALPRRPAVRAHGAPAARRWTSSRATCAGTCPCGGCCRATWARARRSSPSTACIRAAEAGLQGVLLAPTETLAAQHAETAARLVGALAPAELRHRFADGQGAPRGAGAHRLRRDAAGDRHARAAAGGRALRRPGAAGRRRAAPLRRRAARRARAPGRTRRLRPARAAHDGDADPAHARAHRVRRPGRHHHRRRPVRPAAGA